MYWYTFCAVLIEEGGSFYSISLGMTQERSVCAGEEGARMGMSCVWGQKQDDHSNSYYLILKIANKPQKPQG
jgi:hypothetical protein